MATLQPSLVGLLRGRWQVASEHQSDSEFGRRLILICCKCGTLCGIGEREFIEQGVPDYIACTCDRLSAWREHFGVLAEVAEQVS